jgi:tetratricopeptide (TPR) repeat protein
MAASCAISILADSGGQPPSQFTNAYWWRGLTRDALGRVESAISDFSKVIEQSPAFAAAYFNRGRLLCNQQQFESALPDLQRTVELNPGDPMAHHFSSLCLYNLERYAEAEAAASQAIALAPQVGETWFFRAVARYASKDAIHALDDVRRAVELNPHDLRAVEFRDQLESYLHSG